MVTGNNVVDDSPETIAAGWRDIRTTWVEPETIAELKREEKLQKDREKYRLPSPENVLHSNDQEGTETPENSEDPEKTEKEKEVLEDEVRQVAVTLMMTGLSSFLFIVLRVYTVPEKYQNDFCERWIDVILKYFPDTTLWKFYIKYKEEIRALIATWMLGQAIITAKAMERRERKAEKEVNPEPAKPADQKQAANYSNSTADLASELRKQMEQGA